MSLKILGRIAFGILATPGITANAELIPPFLPAETPSGQYAGKTVSASSLRIPLNNGPTLVPGDFLSEKSLDGQWKISGLENSAEPFSENADLDKDFSRPDFNDENWDAIEVPLDWYRKYPGMRTLDKDGKTCSKPYIKGWYRMQVPLTGQDLRGKSVTLHFGVAPYAARLFINGHDAGSHHGDFTPWDVNITEFLKPGPNTVAFRLIGDFGPVFSGAAKSTHERGHAKGVTKGVSPCICEITGI